MAIFRRGPLALRGVEHKTNTSLCLVNDTRYGHSYYKMRIGNRTELSSGTIFNDLERPLTQMSKSRRYLTLNISETVYEILY